MRLDFTKNKNNPGRLFQVKIFPDKIFSARFMAIFILFSSMGVVAGNLGYADEEEKRRVDISLTIFPRIVAVDNNFRSKLDSERKVNLVFVYFDGKERAKSLAKVIEEKNKNIGGMGVVASTMAAKDLLSENYKGNITAIFISERLNENIFNKVMAFAEKKNRIAFSPFAGDVERGVTVGISVTNRVKPYFNSSTLKRSGIVINALLMKMSKRYE